MSNRSIGYGRSRPTSGSSRNPENSLPKLEGIAKLSDYKITKRLGQGSFGVVLQGKDKQNRIVAIKLILQKENEESFPITAFREIYILKGLVHRNVIEVMDIISDVPSPEFFAEHLPKNNIIYKKEKSAFMVFPYLTFDLCGILRNDQIELDEADRKSLMIQLFRGINFIHSKNFLHRDIKAANLLINHEGVLKIGDFGLVKEYHGEPPTYDRPGGGYSPLTEVVMTRWYRAPEVLFGDRFYTTAIDFWSIGCVLGEMYERTPILNGSSDLNQVLMIFDLVGNPSPSTRKFDDWCKRNNSTPRHIAEPKIDSRFSDLSPSCLHLLKGLLQIDPLKRITGAQALEHPWFAEEPLPEDHIKANFPDCHESDVPATTAAKSRNQQQPPLQITPHRPEAPPLPAIPVRQSQELYGEDRSRQNQQYQQFSQQSYAPAPYQSQQPQPYHQQSYPQQQAYPAQQAYPSHQQPYANPQKNSSFGFGSSVVRPKTNFLQKQLPSGPKITPYTARNERIQRSSQQSYGDYQQSYPNQDRSYNNYSSQQNNPRGFYGDQEYHEQRYQQHGYRQPYNQQYRSQQSHFNHQTQSYSNNEKKEYGKQEQQPLRAIDPSPGLSTELSTDEPYAKESNGPDKNTADQQKAQESGPQTEKKENSDLHVLIKSAEQPKPQPQHPAKSRDESQQLPPPEPALKPQQQQVPPEIALPTNSESVPPNHKTIPSTSDQAPVAPSTAIASAPTVITPSISVGSLPAADNAIESSLKAQTVQEHNKRGDRSPRSDLYSFDTRRARFSPAAQDNPNNTPIKNARSFELPDVLRNTPPNHNERKLRNINDTLNPNKRQFHGGRDGYGTRDPKRRDSGRSNSNYNGSDFVQKGRRP